jgi:hypothetical protein
LATQVNVNSIAQDGDGDGVYLQILSATHGTAKLSKDGTSIIFTPEAGYAGQTTITLQADDGFAQSAPIDLTVNVSGAALEQIHISRLATLSTGTARFMTITGDFADEKGVTITGNYLQYTSSNTAVVMVK